MEIPVYILHCMLRKGENEQIKIIGMSTEPEPVTEKLDAIKRNQAKDYIEVHGYAQVNRGKRCYEVLNGNGSYALFLITEETLNLSDAITGNIMEQSGLSDDRILECLWERFGDVLIDDNECILDDFLGFPCGTHREEVWHWFDRKYSKGVAALMFGGE